MISKEQMDDFCYPNRLGWIHHNQMGYIRSRFEIDPFNSMNLLLRTQIRNKYRTYLDVTYSELDNVFWCFFLEKVIFLSRGSVSFK